MSFINKTNTSFINAKLTDTGRKLLASGELEYKFFAFGDSEIDYRFGLGTDYLKKNNMILSPKDNNPNIKYPISSILSGTPFNNLPQISSVESKITNVAKTRGFFNITGSTVEILENGYTSGPILKFTLNKFSGTTTLGISTGITTNIVVGDYLMIALRNPSITLPAQENYKIHSGETIPYLWYKIMGKSASSLTLDRPLPNFSYVGSDFATGYVYPYASGNSINNFYGSATTIPYWSLPSLSFESNVNVAVDEVKLWNMNIIFSENLAGANLSTVQGIDKFPSSIYNGFKEYVNAGLVAPQQKSLGIIHYTNNTISNFYGEHLVDNTLVLKLPTLLYSEETQNILGLTLSARTTTLTLSSSSSPNEAPFKVKYNLLVDKFNNTVGKVFTDLKTIIIEDEEILAAMSYKSNRNWTLPRLIGNFVASQTGEANGLLSQVEQAHVSYLLANESGNGYTTPLHCQKYSLVTRGGVNQNNILLKFPVGKLPFMNSSGFTANKLYILVQKTLNGVRPASNGWKMIDVTSEIRNYTSGNINKLDLENSEFIIDLAKYNTGTNYDLSSVIDLPLISDNNKMQFGEEVFFYGNVDTHIGATVYKSSFNFTAPSSLFNSSVNPTFNNGGEVWISEVGIYDSLKRLVAIGKLSNPIRKKPTETPIIQLDIDF